MGDTKKSITCTQEQSEHLNELLIKVLTAEQFGDLTDRKVALEYDEYLASIIDESILSDIRKFANSIDENQSGL